MMRRYVFAFAPISLVLLFAACGGSSNADDGDANREGTPTSADETQAATSPTATVTDVPIAQPTPVPADFVVLQAVNEGEVFAPTRAEFAALPQTEISHDGTTYAGVSVAALGAELGARDGAIVTIEGTRMDNRRLGIIRFTIEELSDNTVLVVTDEGHINLASTSVPPEQWLNTVTGISFN